MINIAIFSNDAGSSEILKALYIKYKNIYNFKLFYLPSSPFEKLIQSLEHKDSILNNQNNIYKKLYNFKPDIILYGTSWQVTTQKYFLNYAKQNSIISIAFLDHWVDYSSRFKDGYPTFIATFDENSTQIAKNLNLPSIVQIKNYYFESLKQQFKSLKIEPKKQILFLSEPTSKVAKKRFNDEKYWGFNENDIYLEILNFAKTTNTSLLVRLHPSDEKEKYLNINADTIFSTSSLLEDILSSELIIGIDTVALYTAYILRKKTIALMPTDKRKVTLPLPKENIVKTLKGLKLSQIKLFNADLTDTSMEFSDLIQREFL